MKTNLLATLLSLSLVQLAGCGGGEPIGEHGAALVAGGGVGHLPFPTGDGYIADKWNRLGGVSSPLGDYAHTFLCWGQPIKCQVGPAQPSVAVGPGEVGLRQQFANGQIYWSPQTGANAVWGPILDKYLALGAADAGAPCGFPLNDRTSTGDPFGFFNDFQGATILWTASTGAHEVHGAIRDKYRALGAGRSVIGYPLSDDRTAPDGIGHYNDFQYGSIYWSPSLGAFEMPSAIRDRWLGLGGVNSYLGYPTSDLQTVSLPFYGAVRVNSFQRGKIAWTLDGAIVEVPDSVSFHEQVVTPSGTALGGWVEVTLQSNGAWTFKGHMHDSGFDPYSFRVVAVVNSAAGIPVAAQQSGSVGGTISGGSRDFDWNQTGSDPLLSTAWDSVRTGTLSVNKSYEDTGVLGTIEDIGKKFLDSLAADAVISPGVWSLIAIGSEVGKISGVHWAPPNGLVGVIVYGATAVIAGAGAFALAIVAADGIHSRQLTAAEQGFADQVFKGTVPYDRVVLTDMVGAGGRAFTFPSVDGTILVNLGAAYNDPMNSKSNGSKDIFNKGEVFIHELTHAWQIMHDNFVSGWMCDALGTQAVNTGGVNVYKYGPPTSPWSAFNLEQQASIVDQWFAGARVTGQKAMDRNDPYFWYIANRIWVGQD
jgi:hypothetical protein